MVKVSWSRSENMLQEISPADGPGDHTDDIDIDSVEPAFTHADYIDEEVVAGVVAARYTGEFSSKDCRVTADSYEDGEDTITTIAFIELDNPQDQQEAVSCDKCRPVPSTKVRLREEADWLYEDLLCTSCGQVLHTELIQKPVEKADLATKS